MFHHLGMMEIEKRNAYQELFTKTPAKALKHRTRDIIAQLDEKKFLMWRGREMRDWRGFQDKTHIREGPPKYCESQTMFILSKWELDDLNTIEELLNILEEIGRFDIIDDALEFMHEDALSYNKNGGLKLQIPVQIHEVSSASPIYDQSIFGVEASAVGDEVSRGLYDSYICYEESDVEFVQIMVNKLECDPHNLKLCIPERDLTAHGLVEHSAIINFIRNRCKSMVIVLSEAFIQSAQNSFLTMLAQAISVELRNRMLIPVIYQSCQLPTTLQALSKLDYTRGDRFSCFWVRLAGSIRQSSGYDNSLYSTSTIPTPPSPMITGNRSPGLLPSTSSGYSSLSVNMETKMESSSESSSENLSSKAKMKKVSSRFFLSKFTGQSQNERHSPDISELEIVSQTVPSPTSSKKHSKSLSSLKGKFSFPKGKRSKKRDS